MIHTLKGFLVTNSSTHSILQVYIPTLYDKTLLSVPFIFLRNIILEPLPISCKSDSYCHAQISLHLHICKFLHPSHGQDTWLYDNKCFLFLVNFLFEVRHSLLWFSKDTGMGDNAFEYMYICNYLYSILVLLTVLCMSNILIIILKLFIAFFGSQSSSSPSFLLYWSLTFTLIVCLNVYWPLTLHSYLSIKC